MSILGNSAMSAWTPESLQALLQTLPGHAEQPDPLTLLPDDPEDPSSTLALHRVLPELGQIALDPALNWSRARTLTEAVAPQLGKAYRLTLALHALALGARKDDEAAVTFVVTTWELGALCGVSADYISELLGAYRQVLEKLFYWDRSVVNAPFQEWARRARETDGGKPVRFVAGLLFHVKLPERPLTPNALSGKRVKGNPKFFVRTQRDLRGDILRGWTRRRLKDEGKLPSNPRGTVRNRMLSATTPDDDALEVLRYVTLRVRGLLPPDLLSDAMEQVTGINALLAALKTPPTREQHGRRLWVQRCALGFVQVLGRPNDLRHWLGVCWTALNVTGAGIGDGVGALYEATFEVLVRSSDNPKLHGGAPSRLLRWLLRKAGFFEWREEYRKVRAAV